MLQPYFTNTKESIIEKTYSSENLPQPLFAKEGEFLPFVKPACRQAGEGRRDFVSSVYAIAD